MLFAFLELLEVELDSILLVFDFTSAVFFEELQLLNEIIKSRNRAIFCINKSGVYRIVN